MSSLIEIGRTDASEVRLELPPGAQGTRVARLVAVDAASRAGFDYDDSDDLRLAVDELCHAAYARSDGGLSLWFITTPGSVTVRGLSTPGARRAADDEGAPALSWLAHQIVDAVADGYSFELRDASIHFWLLKRGHER